VKGSIAISLHEAGAALQFSEQAKNRRFHMESNTDIDVPDDDIDLLTMTDAELQALSLLGNADEDEEQDQSEDADVIANQHPPVVESTPAVITQTQPKELSLSALDSKRSSELERYINDQRAVRKMQMPAEASANAVVAENLQGSSNDQAKENSVAAISTGEGDVHAVPSVAVAVERNEGEKDTEMKEMSAEIIRNYRASLVNAEADLEEQRRTAIKDVERKLLRRRLKAKLKGKVKVVAAVAALSRQNGISDAQSAAAGAPIVNSETAEHTAKLLQHYEESVVALDADLKHQQEINRQQVSERLKARKAKRLNSMRTIPTRTESESGKGAGSLGMNADRRAQLRERLQRKVKVATAVAALTQPNSGFSSVAQRLNERRVARKASNSEIGAEASTVPGGGDGPGDTAPVAALLAKRRADRQAKLKARLKTKVRVLGAFSIASYDT
jgi:hypothetical protein